MKKIKIKNSTLHSGSSFTGGEPSPALLVNKKKIARYSRGSVAGGEPSPAPLASILKSVLWSELHIVT
jgi:hypothetical protein